jgi:hypothetical protein
MALKTTGIQDIAEAVLACVCVTLDQVAAANPDQPGCPTCRSCVVAGQVAWDDCSNPCGSEEGVGGQLTVSVGRWFLSTNFPAEDRTVLGQRTCVLPPSLSVEIIVTLLRCAPEGDTEGCPPTCAELTEAARIAHTDLTSIINALFCCLPGTTGTRQGQRFVLGAGKMLGPDGGCVGVEQRLTVEVKNCFTCPEEAP